MTAVMGRSVDMELEEALYRVRQDCASDPMRGLVWLAALSGIRMPALLDEKVQPLADELMRQELARARPRLHDLLHQEQLHAWLQGLPQRVSYRFLPPDGEWRHAKLALKFGEMPLDQRLQCMGLQAGTFFTPVQPARWTLAGLALRTSGYQVSVVPEWGDTRSGLPPSSVLRLCTMNAAPAQEGDVAPCLGFHRPVGRLPAAFEDVHGTVHDVADLLTERLDYHAMEWLARGMMASPELCTQQQHAAAHCWALELARLHDMARWEYQHAYEDKGWSRKIGARNPMAADGWVAATIVRMLAAGVPLTPEVWGPHRYFGGADRSGMHHLAVAVVSQQREGEAIQVQALQQLVALGHDVGVPRATHRAGKAKVHAVVPLVTAVMRGHLQCAAFLLEQGADPRAVAKTGKVVQNAYDTAANLDSDATLSLLRAHEARAVAHRALDAIHAAKAVA